MTYLEIETLINKPYLTSREVADLASCNIKYARNLIAEIKKEMAENGLPVFEGKKSLVPTQFVLKKLHINASYVRKQAKEIREAQL